MSEDQLSKAFEELEKKLVDHGQKIAKDSFNKGAMAVITTLKEAMKVAGVNYLPAMWLDTAEKQVLGWNK